MVDRIIQSEAHTTRLAASYKFEDRNISALQARYTTIQQLVSDLHGEARHALTYARIHRNRVGIILRDLSTKLIAQEELLDLISAELGLRTGSPPIVDYQIPHEASPRVGTDASPRRGDRPEEETPPETRILSGRIPWISGLIQPAAAATSSSTSHRSGVTETQIRQASEGGSPRPGLGQIAIVRGGNLPDLIPPLWIPPTATPSS